MKFIKNLFNGIHLCMVWFAILQLLSMTILISIQVFCRELLNFSISWVEEVALLLMIWFSFIALAIGVKEKLHISIELFTMKLPENILKNVIFRITYVATIFFGIVMVVYGFKLVENGTTSTLAATGLPTSVEYVFLPIVGVLIVYDSLMNLLQIDKSDRYINEGFMKGGKKNG